MTRLMWTAALLLLASSIWAQSLAEIARKEKERREKVEASEEHVYTEQDLRNTQGPLTQVTGSSTAEEGETSEASEETEAAETEDPTQTEAYWRSRLDPLDERIREMEERLQQPQYTENMTGGAARAALERQLSQARAQRQAILDEGRRAGVPPGWLR